MDKKLNIFILTTVYGSPWAGSEEQWYSIARHLLAQHHKVTISAFDPLQTSVQWNVLQKEGATIYFRKRKNMSFQRKWNEWFTSIPYLNKNLPDKIILSVGSIPDLYMYPDVYRFLIQNPSIPVLLICTFNSDYLLPNTLTQEYLRKFLHRCNGIHFFSEQNKRLAERQYVLSLPQAQVFPSTLPISVAKAFKPLHNSIPLFTMAAVGRLDVYNKGQDILLEALSSDKWKKREWRLHIYGRGVDESYINDLIAFYSLQDKVFLKGFLTNIEKDIWEENNILVMPSRSEGQSLAFLEAMACGRICIATDVGGFSEVLQSGKNGFLAVAPVAKYLDQALDEAWENRMQFESIARQAHLDVSAMYSVDPTIRALHWLNQLS